MRCPSCGKELWETSETIELTNKNEPGCYYQCPIIIYWCANSCSLNWGCGYSEIKFED